MKKFLIYLLTGLLSSLLFPLLAVAETLEVNNYEMGTTLLVTQNVVFDKAHSPYLLQGIKIESGGNLVFEPGVHLLLSPGANIENSGSFSAVGEVGSEILISALGSAPWGKINSEYDAFIALSYLTANNFLGPHTIKSQISRLSDIDFVDGIQNSLVLGRKEYPLEKRGPLVINQLRFMSYLYGETVQRAGIEAYGDYADVKLYWIRIMNGAFKYDTYPSKYEINFYGKQKSWAMASVFFPGTYKAISSNEFVTVSGYPCNRLTFRMSPYEQKLDIPVIFVPGYGTSINLKNLLNPGSGTANDKWTINPALTPAYAYFMKDVDMSHVWNFYATYDWRLPAEQIVEQYLVPLIEKVKKDTGYDVVNLVCHSFGGVVARTYAQSSQYHNDIRNLVMIGTPNQGAAKAYGVWEAASLPKDWAILEQLLRVYKYQTGTNDSNLTILHNYFPSAGQMMPIYPAIIENNRFVDPSTMYYSNQALLNLKNNFNPGSTIKYTTVSSRSEPTLSRIMVNKNPNNHTAYWKDGKPTEDQPSLLVEGDGTVPYESVLLPGVNNIEVSGKHADLPELASEKIFKILYPTIPFRPLGRRIGIARKAESLLWFLFDCPIKVKITTPQGEIIRFNSFDPNNLGFSSSPNDEYAFSMTQSDEMAWYIVPREVGNYKVEIAALEDTSARYWTDTNTIHTVQMQKNQLDVLKYALTDLADDSGRFSKVSSEIKPDGWGTCTKEPFGEIEDCWWLDSGDDPGGDPDEIIDGDSESDSDGDSDSGVGEVLAGDNNPSQVTVAQVDELEVSKIVSKIDYLPQIMLDYTPLSASLSNYEYKVQTLNTSGYWQRLSISNQESVHVLNAISVSIKPKEVENNSLSSAIKNDLETPWWRRMYLAFVALVSGVVAAIYYLYRKRR